MLRFGHPPAHGDHAARLPLARLAFVSVALSAFLAGCGFRFAEPREPWRAEAELACMKSGIIRESAYMRPWKPIEGPGPCGADLPIKVSAFESEMTASSPAMSYSGFGAPVPRIAPQETTLNLTVLKPESLMTCPMVAWTDDWVSGSVQPAAFAWFGMGVKEIRTAGTYACRRRNHQSNAKLSEHAFGNAIDVMAFVLANGDVITIKGGWKGTGPEQGFLRDVFIGACERFKTALGPGSNALHYDHFHFDLARHDSAGKRRYCNPRLAPVMRPMPGSFAQPAPQAEPPGLVLKPGFAPPPLSSGNVAPMPPANRPLPTDQPETEEEFDPKAFDLTGSTLDLPKPRRRASDATNPRAPINQPLPERTDALPTPKGQ